MQSDAASERRGSLRARLGLAGRAVRAWVAYDWANSAFFTVVVTAVFPPYFRRVVVGEAAGRRSLGSYALATTVGLAAVALVAPWLGEYADRRAQRKGLLTLFMLLGAGSTAALALGGPGDRMLALILFGLANVGAAGSLIFYDSLLPHVALEGEVDRVSAAGYAVGYLGGGLYLAVALVAIMHPEWVGLGSAAMAMRLSFVGVALWWAGFSIPLLRQVPEPRAARRQSSRGILSRLVEVVRDLRRYPQAFLFLLAFLCYNDAIQTTIRMATIFGADVGIGDKTLISAVLVVQFLGVPFAFIFGALGRRVGTKPALLVGVGAYLFVTAMAYRLSGPSDFWLLAVVVAAVQGGTQALSRSLFASMIPAEKSAEFFGLFAIFEKFAAILGPALFGMAVTLSGSSRLAILSLLPLLMLGGLLLVFVDPAAGRRAARA